MKKLLMAIVLSLLTLTPCYAQQGVRSQKFNFTGTSTPINLINTAIIYHKLTWNVSGTASACTVALDTSANGSTWSAGGAITGQTCTSNGSSSTVNVSANYVRINMTALTVTAGSSVTVTWDGYTSNPSGGIGGSISADQVAYGTAANTIGGSNNFKYSGGTLIANVPTAATQVFQTTSGTGPSDNLFSLYALDTSGPTPGGFFFQYQDSTPHFIDEFFQSDRWVVDVAGTNGASIGVYGDPGTVIFPDSATPFLTVDEVNFRLCWDGSSTGQACIGRAAAQGTPNPINLPTATGGANNVLVTDGGSPQQLSWKASAAVSDNCSQVGGVAYYNTSSTVQCDTGITSNGSGQLSTSGGIVGTSDGTNAGQNALVGNTGDKPLVTNAYNFEGPPTATYTAFFDQPASSTSGGPASANSVKLYPAASGSPLKSAWTWGTVAPLVNGHLDGTAPVTITTGTTATLGAGSYQSGYTLNQEATAGTGVTYTLPATATGKQYCVANSGTTGVVNTGVLTVYPPASSYVILNGVVNTVGGGGTHGVVSGGAAGDAACFVAIDSTHWQVWVGKGTWTEN